MNEMCKRSIRDGKKITMTNQSEVEIRERKVTGKLIDNRPEPILGGGTEIITPRNELPLVKWGRYWYRQGGGRKMLGAPNLDYPSSQPFVLGYGLGGGFIESVENMPDDVRQTQDFLSKMTGRARNGDILSVIVWQYYVVDQMESLQGVAGYVNAYCIHKDLLNSKGTQYRRFNKDQISLYLSSIIMMMDMQGA